MHCGPKLVQLPGQVLRIGSGKEGEQGGIIEVPAAAGIIAACWLTSTTAGAICGRITIIIDGVRAAADAQARSDP